VNEQLSRGEDVILVPVEALVCNNFGERCYDRPFDSFLFLG